MSHRNVELLIGRLATDAGLCRRFEDRASLLLDELIAQGYEFSAIEIEALSALDVDALRQFAATLDRRLRKANHTATSTHLQN